MGTTPWRNDTDSAGYAQSAAGEREGKVSFVTSLISRRTFCRMLAGIAVASPGVAIAQASKAVHRIGIIEIGDPGTPEQLQEELPPLRDLGWVEGQNLHVERRYANHRLDALEPLAQELVRARVEVILTSGDEIPGAIAQLARQRVQALVLGRRH